MCCVVIGEHSCKAHIGNVVNPPVQGSFKMSCKEDLLMNSTKNTSNIAFRNLAIGEYLRANGFVKSLEAFKEEAELV